MSAEEKAQELVIKFLTASFGTMEEYVPVPKEFAKQCAIIAIDEIISSYSQYKERYEQDIFDNEVSYWQEVKQLLQTL